MILSMNKIPNIKGYILGLSTNVSGTKGSYAHNDCYFKI